MNTVKTFVWPEFTHTTCFQQEKEVSMSSLIWDNSSPLQNGPAHVLDL